MEGAMHIAVLQNSMYHSREEGTIICKNPCFDYRASYEIKSDVPRHIPAREVYLKGTSNLKKMSKP